MPTSWECWTESWLTLPPIQFPVYGSWKGTDGGTNAWAPATLVGDPDEVLGSWLWPGPALAIADIWGSEPADGRSLSFSCSAFQVDESKHI